MSEYRRWRVAGGIFFFTIVTHERKPLFAEQVARQFLRESMIDVKHRRPFEIPAIVLLPDHFHFLMQLPEKDSDYSVRIRQFKTLFTRRLAQTRNTQQNLSASRTSRSEHSIWQRRFYEHFVRDEKDFHRCADYIHVNPVKHRCVKRVIDWPWSSFHRWLAEGYYQPGWGDGSDWFGDEFKKFE